MHYNVQRVGTEIMHVNSLSLHFCTWHVPLFLHGFGWQSSISSWHWSPVKPSLQLHWNPFTWSYNTEMYMCMHMNTYYGELKMIEFSLRVDVVLPDTALYSCKDLGCSYRYLLNSRHQCSPVHIRRCTLMDFPIIQRNKLSLSLSPPTL